MVRQSETPDRQAEGSPEVLGDLPKNSLEDLEWPAPDLQPEDGLPAGSDGNQAAESISGPALDWPDPQTLENPPDIDSLGGMETSPGITGTTGDGNTPQTGGLLGWGERELPDLPGEDAITLHQEELESLESPDLGSLESLGDLPVQEDIPDLQESMEESREIPEGIPEHEDLFPQGLQEVERDPLEKTLQDLTTALEKIKTPTASQYGEEAPDLM